MFNINPNMQIDFNEINQTCLQHFACENCPVLEKNGLHKQNSVILCHKVEEKLMRERQNGNSKM